MSRMIHLHRSDIDDTWWGRVATDSGAGPNVQIPANAQSIIDTLESFLVGEYRTARTAELQAELAKVASE